MAPTVAAASTVPACAAGPRTFYGILRGGGMARAGLDPGWRCLFAKSTGERQRSLQRELARATSPSSVQRRSSLRRMLCRVVRTCQDLSLAGNYALKGQLSGSFRAVLGSIQQLRRERRAPRTVVL
jgi:DNA (cytosine-5)-methyltransferase 1